MKKEKNSQETLLSWTKIQFDLVNDERIQPLVEKEGMRGLGAYVCVTLAIMQRPKQRITLRQLRQLSLRGYKHPEHLLTYGTLFRQDEKGFVYPLVGLCAALKPADTASASAPHGQPIVLLSDNAAPTDPEGLCARTYREEESREEFLLTTATPDLLAELRPDDPWAEAVMMRSGFSGLLARHWAEAIRQFRLHVVANENLRGIRTLREAKQYFSSFTTHPVTGPALRKALEAYEARHPEENPYRFEDKGSCPGHRSYHGIDLPDCAPPRPDERADWDFAEQCWIVI
ncbi:MAG: hypothetical protein ACI3ZY_02225 [Parabacteroides sp.]